MNTKKMGIKDLLYVIQLFVTYIHVTQILIIYKLHIYKDDDEKRSIEHVIRTTQRTAHNHCKYCFFYSFISNCAYTVRMYAYVLCEGGA